MNIYIYIAINLITISAMFIIFSLRLDKERGEHMKEMLEYTRLLVDFMKNREMYEVGLISNAEYRQVIIKNS